MPRFFAQDFSVSDAAREPYFLHQTLDMTVSSLCAAQTLLQNYTCLESRSLPTATAKADLQAALRQVVAASDRQLFGVCADSLTSGLAALQVYLAALGVAIKTINDLGIAAPETVSGPVYIKFNSSNGRCFWESYRGEFRGILVSCQSDLDDGINATYGHLPLDLFATDL